MPQFSVTGKNDDYLAWDEDPLLEFESLRRSIAHLNRQFRIMFWIAVVGWTIAILATTGLLCLK